MHRKKKIERFTYFDSLSHIGAIILFHIMMRTNDVLQIIINYHARSLGARSPKEDENAGASVGESRLQ